MSAPVSYTNDIRSIAALDNFISINNCVDIDLFGQISAESSGTKHISGAGGQLDFVLGAYMSKGGKSFICCLPHSRIRKVLCTPASARPWQKVLLSQTPVQIPTMSLPNMAWSM